MTTLEAVAQASGGAAGADTTIVGLMTAAISAVVAALVFIYLSGQKQAREARGERDGFMKELRDTRESHAKAWHDRELAFEKAIGAERLTYANEVSRVRAEYENRIRAMEVTHQASLTAEVRERVEAGERDAARTSVEREKMNGALGAISVTLGKIESHISPERQR